MCEYCGCQEIAVIDELTGEHDAVVGAVSDVRRALAAGSVPAAAEACRKISALLEPAHGGRGGGLFPAMAGRVPRPRRRARARNTARIDAVLARRRTGTPEDPTWPARLLRTLAGPARAHPQGAGRGLSRRARGARQRGQWERDRKADSAPVSAPPFPPPCTTTARHEPHHRGGTVVTSTNPPETPGLDDPLTEALVRTPPVLHPGRGLAGPAHAAPDRRPRRPTPSTGTGGATTRSCAPPTA